MVKHTLSWFWIVIGITCHTVFAAEQPMEKANELVEHNQLMSHGDGHLMDMEGGMVMGQNKEKLPPGCSRISEDADITVHAGHNYTKGFPGTMFGFDQHEWRVKPCTRLTVHFINEDHVRHQWMMHGLPKFLYDKGMFHLEVTGPAKISGTLILPAEDRTYLVHCDIAQHMEKGMKGQLIVGKGNGTFPTIPGITDPAIVDEYGPIVPDPTPPVAPPPVPQSGAPSSVGNTTGVFPGGSADLSASTSPDLFLLGLLLGILGTPFAISAYQKRCGSTNTEEILTCSVKTIGEWIDRICEIVKNMFKPH